MCRLDAMDGLFGRRGTGALARGCRGGTFPQPRAAVPHLLKTVLHLRKAVPHLRKADGYGEPRIDNALARPKNRIGQGLQPVPLHGERTRGRLLFTGGGRGRVALDRCASGRFKDGRIVSASGGEF